jgi:hypothetical protein
MAASERERVVFRLERTGTERLWATRVRDDVVKVDDVPFFVRDLAWGDLVRTESRDGEIWAVERLKWSGRCTVRVVPLRDGPLAGSLPAVLDAFRSLGVGGEGSEEHGIVALDVPEIADPAPVVRLLRQGVADGWWDYEEGCVGDDWPTP